MNIKQSDRFKTGRFFVLFRNNFSGTFLLKAYLQLNDKLKIVTVSVLIAKDNNIQSMQNMYRFVSI